MCHQSVTAVASMRVAFSELSSELFWCTADPVKKIPKKTKLSPQKGAFASIFRKANQRVLTKKSPGRRKSLSPAKVTSKAGSMLFHCL